ncbi:MAG: HPr(Ser) kinase/phosphatase [Clostridia bacterium]|nr:HPr(Ser) kinase/phosphatase [Clostridia bacterium]
MTSEVYSVSLNSIIQEMGLTVQYMPEGEEVLITCKDVNRPGLPLAGFYDHFEPQRIQIIGNVEWRYLNSLPVEERLQRKRDFYATKPAAVVFTRGRNEIPEALEFAKEFGVPVLSSPISTTEFMANIIGSLSVSLAQRITRHGVFVEIYGEGVLILGDSGIGKSETAIELVKRGHRLIADDAVEIKKVSNKTLVGTAPEIIRHYIELRGIGIVDVHRIFGMGSVKLSEKIDLVVELEQWDDHKDYDRFGLDTEYINIMGIKVTKLTIPITPGRNLAVILEIAAMNHRQKKMGYNTAEEFNKRLMETYGG